MLIEFQIKLEMILMTGIAKHDSCWRVTSLSREVRAIIKIFILSVKIENRAVIIKEENSQESRGVEAGSGNQNEIMNLMYFQSEFFAMGKEDIS